MKLSSDRSDPTKNSNGCLGINFARLRQAICMFRVLKYARNKSTIPVAYESVRALTAEELSCPRNLPVLRRKMRLKCYAAKIRGMIGSLKNYEKEYLCWVATCILILILI